MKSRLLLTYQYLSIRNRSNSTGFTIIELMVVIIILGILTAIGMKTILNEVPKAKQAEAKSTIAHVNAAQSTYWLTHGSFANAMSGLSIGLPSSTTNYTYNISGDITLGIVNATAVDTMLKGYVGVVERYADANQQSIISAIICESATAGNITSLPTSGRPGTNACGSGNVELGQ
ncbi:type IV pilin-like G/H family protein [Chroococcidiopsis thermalis]|nr:type IV pilin-like G/H family protein [Chroococcidiopsis thermalis]